MKKIQLNLSELKVKSFTTSLENIKGGGSGNCNTAPMNCWAAFTTECGNDITENSGCVTGDVGVGLCEAPTKQCPTRNFC